MSDSSRGGRGGKSLNMVKNQQKRINQKISQAIAAARARGDMDAVRTLNSRRLAMNNVARSYKAAISRNQRAHRNQNVNTNIVDRSVYTKGRMGRSRSGQVGQFRENSSSARNSARRKYNQIRGGARLMATAIREGNANARRHAARFAARNRYMRYGVSQGVSAGYRTNNRQALNARSARDGRNRRVTSNRTNANNARLSGIIRLQRRERRRNR